MNLPRYLTCIKGESGISCTGKQLSAILDLIYQDNKNIIWYGADITTNSVFPTYLNSSIPNRIGDIKDLKLLIQNVEQFLSGVFLGFIRDQNIVMNQIFFTEDKRFRDISEAYFEIRAFDTSYFEIYSNDNKILQHIAKHFSTIIICSSP
ncbi:MAG: hypothetical protein P4L16_06630 [Chlamydiales bacterium]|nr:hypothetical protein [Chlamydiales bacterium]